MDSAAPSFPDVSVVIPSYNVAPYIKRAIHSALDQRDIVVEVIVVDDGSTDGTVSVAKQINDSRLNIVELKENKGPGNARNIGFANAKSLWIAVLDGDDSFLPNRLSNMTKLANELNADIVVDDIYISNESNSSNSRMLKKNLLPNAVFLTLETFIKGNSSFLQGYTLGYLKPMFSRNFLDKNKLTYDVSLNIGEDYLLLCEALASGAKCAIEHKPGYLYTVREHSTSHRIKNQDVEKIIYTDQKLKDEYKLSITELAAQKKRERALLEARAYTQFIALLKERNIKSALLLAVAHLIILRNLWMPVWARIKRLSYFR